MSFAETFSALSDPIRREILLLLRDSKQTAGEITNHFKITGSAISYHLSKLKKADLIREIKYKNFIYYELNASIFDEAILWLEHFKGGISNEK